MATKPKVGQIKSSQPRFELLDASPDQFEAIRFYDDAPAAPAPEEEGRTIGGTIKDVGISALKGAIAVPEAAVGLADLVTGGYAGKLLENEGGAVGFRPKQAKAALDEGYSAPQKAAFARVQAAEGLGDTFMAAVQNPSVIGQSVVESLPLMGAGGVLARGGLALAPRLAAAPGAGIVAGAVGEGAVGAGSAAESIRQQSADGLLTGGQAGLAAASGGATALFGYLGGKVAQKLGIADVDTMLAGAATDPALRKGVVRSALEGAFAEGVLEELPQSISEQVLQNIALDRPLDEGVNQAAVLGLLSGGLMGGGANVVNSITAPAASGLPEPAVKPTAAPAPAGPLTRAANRAAMANLQTVQSEELGMPDVPQTAAPDGRAILLQREEQARLKREAEQAAQRAVEGPDDEILQSTGAQPIMAAAGLPQTASEAEEDAAAQKVIDARRATELAKAPAAAADPEPAGRFTSAKEAQDYISAQRRASSATLPRALPIQNEDGSFGVAVDGTQAFTLAMEQDRVRRLQAAGVLPDDVLNPKGEPFKTKASATTAAKKQGGQVVPVTGGFVVRKQQAVTDGAGAGAAPDAAASDGAGRPDAAPGVGSGMPDGDRLGANTRRAKAGGVGQSFELPFGAADDAVTEQAQAAAPAAEAQPGAAPAATGLSFSDKPDFATTWPRPKIDKLEAAGRSSTFQGLESDEEMLEAVVGLTQETGFGLQSDEADVRALVNGIKRNIDPATGKAPKPGRIEAMRKEIEQGVFSIESTLNEYASEFGDEMAQEFRRVTLPEFEALQKEAQEAVGKPADAAAKTETQKNQEQSGAQPVAESQAPAPEAGEGAAARTQADAAPDTTKKIENAKRRLREARNAGDDAKAQSVEREIRALRQQAMEETDEAPAPVAADREPFTHSGLKVYPTRIRGQDGEAMERWAVQTPENAEREKKGERQIGGDELVPTREEAIKRAEQLAAQAERSAKDKAELEAAERQQAEKDAAKKAEEEDIDGFAEKATKLVRGRIVKTLNTPVSMNGRQTTRKAAVRERVAAGATVQQAKEGRRLVKPDGTYLGEDQITKTGMDYAEHLIAQRGAQQDPGAQWEAMAPAERAQMLDKAFGAGQTDAGQRYAGRKWDSFNAGERSTLTAMMKAPAAASAPTAAPVQATHQDPGEKPEAATPAVVADSLKKAAKNEGMKPSEMKTWLLGEIDKALSDIPGYKDFTELAKSMGETPSKAADRIGNQYAEDGHVTFDVPGDGRFKVAKSVRNLYRFRDSVEKSPAFRDTQRKTTTPVIDSVRNGSRSKDEAVIGMIEEGDFEAAKEYAEAVGIDLQKVKVPRGEFKPQWDEFLKTGKLPENRAIERLTFPVRLDVDSLLNAFPLYRSYGMTEATLEQDGTVKIKSKTGMQGLGTGQGSGSNGSFMAAYVRGELRKTDKPAEEAPAKPKPSDTGWNMAGTGYAGKRYRGRNITLADGREVVARIYENAGAYEEIEIKIDGVSKFRGTDRLKAQEKADAMIAALTTKEPELDLKGFTRTPMGNGIFQLRDGNLMVEVRPELTGLQAVHGSAKSSPRLTEQQAVDWAAKIREESKKLQAQDAKPAAKKATGEDADRLQLEYHFAPGNVILSDYWKKHDRVVSFDWNGGNWSVKVQGVELKDGKWEPVGEIRTHSTRPDKKDKVIERPEQIEPEARDAEGYSLPNGSVWDEWRGSEAPGYEPNSRQRVIMDAVGKAIAEGLFYNDAVRKRTAEILGLKDVDVGEGSTFSTDAYMARKTLEAQKMNAAVTDAFRALNLKDGDKIGVIVTSDGKMSNAVTVTKAGDNGYGMVLEGRRGPAGVRFPSMDALQLKNAIDRAKEKGKRKDGFEEFVKNRGGEQQTEATNDRDTFTLQRLNRDTNQMEPVTFTRGEYITYKVGGKDQFGEIDGISQARKEFSVDGLWHPFGFAYKAERPADPKADTVPLSSVIEKMNAKNGEGLSEADRVPGSTDIGWDTMSPEQRESILSQPGGWSTAKGGLNAVGKGLAKRAWADITPMTRGTIEGLAKKEQAAPAAAPAAPAAAPASKTPMADAHEATMTAVREGNATPEQFKASFEAVVANKEAILAELGTKTKAELLQLGGAWLAMRYKSDTKSEVADAVYRQMVGEYVLGETLSYGMGKGAFEAAVRRHVEATDADKLAQYAKDRKAAVEEALAQRAARVAALENPQTLDDYRNLLNVKIREGMTRKEAFLTLTPEQRVAYDSLEAENTREARERRKRELKTQVRAAGQTTAGDIIATKHTRDGYDLFVVQLADRVSKDDYKTLLAGAKRMGGWYSSFRGNGAVPGFQFKDKAQAEAFLKLAGGDTAAAQEQVQARRDAYEDDRSQSAVERLTAMAEKLDEQAQQAMNVERKTNTARRARFASAAEDAARQQQALAKTMRNIAQAIEAGRAKFLDSVRTKTQVEMLAGAVRTAKDNELRAKYDSYGEQQKRKGQPPTAETADYAEFPSFTAFRSDLASLARQMLEVEGTKKMGAQLMKVADDVTDAYMEFAKANQLQVSQFGNKAGGLAVFASREDAERAIKRSGLVGKAIVLPVKRGENRVILSPSEAMSRGIWTGDGDKRITLTREFGQELVDAIGRRGNKTNGLSVPWQFESASDRLKAMARIGIETPAEFRSALREFIGLQEQAKEADRVKMLERDMVGRKNDGLDFFPTPQTVADQMVEAAGIEPDMAVLEPSAGMGHIADRIREAGAEPDVIEMANDRAELLEAKGFNVLARDFMEIKPRESYTFGDVFKTADGIEGIMRGAGGMGSNRVRLVNEAGDMLGYYDRDELTGVRLRGTESGYDRIIMNPPFSDRRDAEHVRHAFELLRPGGRLVAIMGEGVFFGKDKKAQDFRDWLEEKGGTAEKLPEGSFMDPTLPVNTAVNARMVVIDKPGAQAAKADDAPMFSRSAAARPVAPVSRNPDKTPLYEALRQLSRFDQSFQIGYSDAKELDQIARDMTAGRDVSEFIAEKSTELHQGNRKPTLTLKTKNKAGEFVKILDIFEADSATPFVVIGNSELGQNVGGAYAYQMAFTWAHNNGKRMVPDPAGLTVINRLRRTEAMISSALRHGTTKHLEPHVEQYVALTERMQQSKQEPEDLKEYSRPDLFAQVDALKNALWTNNSDPDSIASNVQHLAEASAQLAAFREPNLRRLEFADGALRKRGDVADIPLEDADIDGATGKVNIRGVVLQPARSGVGSSTVQRYAVVASVGRALQAGKSQVRGTDRQDGGVGRTGSPALAAIRQVLGDISRGPSDGLKGVFYSRGQQAGALTRESTQQIADAISARWANAPEIIVARDMSDYVIPQRVRDSNNAAKSAGASGEPEGFIYQGKVYLIADQLRSSQDVARVLFHEALGHAGLRGVFGDELKPILRQIAVVRAKDVRAKAKEYGLDMGKEADRLQAAEEVLANMAQTAPELGFVKRAIAAIRTWLRNNVALFRDSEITDDEIIRDYILPARGFIERGREAAAPKALPVFSRNMNGPSPVDDDTEALVQEFGEPVASTLDAERRMSDGERIFAMHEMSDTLSEITSVRQLKSWAPDQLIALPVQDGGSFSRADQTNTPEFKAWFGDSKVVDDQGNPLVVYHGSRHNADIKKFSAAKSEQTSAERGIYFTDSAKSADQYASQWGDAGPEDGGSIYPVYLKIEKPYISNAWEWNMGTDITPAQARKRGHDGYVIENHDGGTTYIAFRPEQIKSAIGNVGTFDPANPDIRYSRAAVSNLSNRATDLLNEAFSHPGKLSFWDKSVGSMYHIAQRYPAFRRVFNAAQNFINDVSYYATEAAEQAPKILPRLETWRDLAKSPIKAADNTAISRPILEGTLSWTRDEDGKPVRTEQIEGAGIVWSSAELRSMFNLTDEQIALYREFRAATDLSLDNMGKADLLRYAGKDLADLRDMVMDAPDVTAAAKVMRGQLQELADADPERRTELISMAGDLEKRAEKVADLKARGYAPLSRFGRYTVDVVVKGERKYFSLFDSARDANKMAAKMRAEFGDDAVSQGTLSQREFEAFQGITPESLELFGNMLGLDSTGDEAQDKVFQTYLKLTKANRSALKRLIHRKGVTGYSDDMGRVLAAFVYSNARQTSAALHMGEMGQAVQEIPKGQGELKDVAIELSSYIKQPREEAQALRGLLFAQYLGGSVASAFVNFTQPFTVTFPYLIRFGGARRSAQALMKAMADQRDGVKLEEGLARALKTAEEQGVVAPQEVHQLMAQARGESTLKAGDGTRAGEALAATRNAWTRTTLAWGKMFGMAEQINRRSTFIAAYRIAAERGMRNPAAFATKAVNETQFVNNRANKARWARGPVGATLMTFKSYSVHYMELMHRLATREGPEGKKAAAMMLGMLLLVAGAGGLPFVEDAEDVVDMIAQRMGYNFSSKQAKRQFLEDLFGKAGAQFVEKGVTGLAGSPIDISGRMSMANLIPGTGLLLKKPDQSRDMQELVGPVGDLVKRGWKGADLALSGEFGKALLEVSPRAVANAAKGVDMANTGVYTDTRGRKVIETDLGDAVAKAIGFQPQSVAQVQDATFTVQKMVSQNKMREAEIAEKWAQGIYEGNKAKIEEARQMVRDWNRKNPKTPIKIELPQILKRVRAMRMSKEDRIAKTAPSEIRGAVQRELAAQ